MPQIELNHIWTVLDKPTYDAIKQASTVNSFANTYEQANTADGEMGWEGFYIRGKNTFIELFYPQERYKKAGLSGIGLGFDKLGNLQECFKTFQKSYSQAEYQSFTRNGAPWFDYLSVNGSYYGDGHSLWIMEYSPDYFQENKHDVSRQHYNKAAYDPSKHLQDITGFFIALNKKDQKTLKDYLSLSGMKRIESNTFRNAANIEIKILDESPTQKGICEINLLFNDPYPTSEPLHLGNSVIEFSGKTATWLFRCG
jgi:hypothetical protein